jgi:hypothetical protein
MKGQQCLLPFCIRCLFGFIGNEPNPASVARRQYQSSDDELRDNKEAKPRDEMIIIANNSLLVRARVTSLQEVPQFIVFSVAEGFQGVSWTVQFDIVQQFMLGAQPQDEDPVPPYPHDGHQLSVEFFGMGQPVANFQFDLNIPPMEGNNVEEDVANNDDEGWDPWPVQQAQPPEPVANANNANVANNAKEQFSYQLSGLEDLPSDESVGYFNDIIIPQGV